MIPQSSQVTLTVFDILGKQLSTLVEDLLNPGLHTVVFNGNGLPRGVYISAWNTATNNGYGRHF